MVGNFCHAHTHAHAPFTSPSDETNALLTEGSEKIQPQEVSEQQSDDHLLGPLIWSPAERLWIEVFINSVPLSKNDGRIENQNQRMILWGDNCPKFSVEEHRAEGLL